MSRVQTLPDLLRDGLDLVFVGINPSEYSANVGHYFARPGNRFWPAFSASRLSLRARQGLGVARLQPIHDRCLLEYGIGFTDVAKRPTPNVTGLRRNELIDGARLLRERLDRYRPRVACFHGLTGYRPFCRALGLPWRKSQVSLGGQPVPLGATLCFVVPNPSAANAHFTSIEQTEWYDRLAAFPQTASRSSCTDLRT